MKSINRRTVIGGMLAVGLAGSVKSQTLKLLPAALGQAVNIAAKASIKDRAAPGVAIAVMRQGRLILSRGYGVANLETKTLVRADSVFRIGSLTKQFAAAAAYRLVEQGRLKLDAPVSSIIPAFSRIASIRVEELIHHNAGLHEDEAETAASPDPATTAGPRQIILANAVAAQTKPFDFEVRRIIVSLARGRQAIPRHSARNHCCTVIDSKRHQPGMMQHQITDRFAERLAGDRLDDRAKHDVIAVAVMPGRPRLEIERIGLRRDSVGQNNLPRRIGRCVQPPGNAAGTGNHALHGL